MKKSTVVDACKEVCGSCDVGSFGIGIVKLVTLDKGLTYGFIPQVVCENLEFGRGGPTHIACSKWKQAPELNIEVRESVLRRRGISLMAAADLDLK